MEIRDQAVHASPVDVKALFASVSTVSRWADLPEFSDAESAGTQGMSEPAFGTPRECPAPPVMLQVRGIPYPAWYNEDRLRGALEVVNKLIDDIAQLLLIDKDVVRWKVSVERPYKAPAGTCWVHFTHIGEDADSQAILGHFLAGAKKIQHGSQPVKIEQLRLFVQYPRKSDHAKHARRS